MLGGPADPGRECLARFLGKEAAPGSDDQGRHDDPAERLTPGRNEDDGDERHRCQGQNHDSNVNDEWMGRQAQDKVERT